MAGEIGIMIDGFTLEQINQIIASISSGDDVGIVVGDHQGGAHAIAQQEKSITKIGIINEPYMPEWAAMLGFEF
jgi:hypothetical protein